MKKETKKRVLLSAILAKIAIVAILFSFSSCDEEDDPPTPTPDEPIEIELTEQEENLVTASNSFSFKLFKKLYNPSAPSAFLYMFLWFLSTTPIVYRFALEISFRVRGSTE